MTSIRMDARSLDTRLDASLHAADLGDPVQARQLHDLLDAMLTERESPEGRYWLTDHGRAVLAEMHRALSHCGDDGARLRDHVLRAVHLNVGPGHWKDSCSYVSDLRVAIAVANELCAQRREGGKPDLETASQVVAGTGTFELSAKGVRQVYEQVAAAVGGFREIARS